MRALGGLRGLTAACRSNLQLVLTMRSTPGCGVARRHIDRVQTIFEAIWLGDEPNG